MKIKKIICAFIVLLSSSLTIAQEGTSIINLQLGISGSIQGTKIKTPAFYGSYEYFLSNQLSIGFIGGHSTLSLTTVEYVGRAREVEKTFSNIIAGALGNYYFTANKPFRVYIGSAIGYASELTGKFLYEFHLGSKYELSDSIILNSEVGVGLSLLKVGLSFKI